MHVGIGEGSGVAASAGPGRGGSGRRSLRRWSGGCLVTLASLSLAVPAGAIRAQTSPGDGWQPPAGGIRPEVGGTHGAVASDHPLATAAGYEVLRAGGNAVDAAVTMAAVLAVVRPHMNGVGGDAFALFFEGETSSVTALNASGRAPEGATPDFFADLGMERMPGSGPHSVTVPGAVAGWQAALDRYGTISLAEALAPAIVLARDGFMVTTTLSDDLRVAAARLNPGGQGIYRPGDRPLEAGDLLRSPALARSLEILARDGPAALYGGELGASVARFLESEGSAMRLPDLAGYDVEWTEPLSTPFRGRTVHTVRPNSQGISLLQMLGMIEHLPLERRRPNSTDLLHELVEIVKLAFADRDRWVFDPAHGEIPLDRLRDPGYLGERAALIPPRASDGQPATGFADEFTVDGDPDGSGDTVYLMAVDRRGNAVSWIQSLFGTFGSNLVDPETGIVLQNRGAGFTLDAGSPNRIGPGKRPFHTLMATLVTDAAGGFEMAIGTPGGGGQPQFIAQALVQMLVYDMSPQQAIEAPRFRVGGGRSLAVEDRLPPAVLSGLAERGHELGVTSGWTANFGNLQVIRRLPNGVLRTGADMRREGSAMAY